MTSEGECFVYVVLPGETMRRVGVSERYCEAIRSAFLYDGLFYESGLEDV